MQNQLDKLQSYPGTPLFKELLRDRSRQYAMEIGRPNLTEKELKEDRTLSNEFDEWTVTKRRQEINSMYKNLERLNPRELASIKRDPHDEKAVFDIVYGVVSGFSPDDISCYIGKAYQNDHEDTERRKKESEVLKLLDSAELTLGWIASESTLSRIVDQLKAKGVRSSQSEILPHHAIYER